MILHSTADRTTHCPSVTETIVDHVAAAEDVDPLDLPPLWHAIDTDALDALFAPGRSGRVRAGTVQFEYHGYEVTVAQDERLTVALDPIAGDR